MHGVGGAAIERAFVAAGFDVPHVVAAQHEPDGTFPTVAFPNPEEPGAMDLLLELARECDAVVALANDPDADRLGAAIPQADGSWRRLTGDEIGWLFADHILRQHVGRRSPRDHHDRVVVAARPDGGRRRGALRGDVHRLQVDRQDRQRTSRAAIRVRLRAGARVPRDASPARQGRHQRGGDDGRDRRRGAGRWCHAAGSARRDRGAVRSVRDRRAVGAPRPGARRRVGEGDRSRLRRPRSTGASSTR